MKSISNTKTFEADGEKMTLADYYRTLPIRLNPKLRFIDQVCDLCEVNENTVRNWIAGRSRPQKESHYQILSQLTGIPADSLFDN